MVSVAGIVAVGANSDGRREVLGMDVGPVRGRHLPDGLTAQARPTGPAGHLGRARGHQDLRRQGYGSDLAALPRGLVKNPLFGRWKRDQSGGVDFGYSGCAMGPIDIEEGKVLLQLVPQVCVGMRVG